MNEAEEQAYVAGGRAAAAHILASLRPFLGGEGMTAEAWRLERADAVRELRDLCEQVGADTSWPDELNLGDVIAKKLGRAIPEVLQDAPSLELPSLDRETPLDEAARILYDAGLLRGQVANVLRYAMGKPLYDGTVLKTLADLALWLRDPDRTTIRGIGTTGVVQLAKMLRRLGLLD